MAAGTARIRIGVATGIGTPAYDAAPGKAWTSLVAGVVGVIIRPDKNMPEFEFYIGATGSPPVAASDGIPFVYGESQFLQIANLAGNSIWYRAAQDTSFTFSKDA